MRAIRNVYKVLIGKPAWEITIGKACCRWEGNIKVDDKEIGCGIEFSWLSIGPGD
jgi:hypothetical protein